MVQPSAPYLWLPWYVQSDPHGDVESRRSRTTCSRRQALGQIVVISDHLEDCGSLSRSVMLGRSFELWSFEEVVD